MLAEAARQFLEERFGPDVLVTPMRAGEWSTVLAVRTADRDLVVRFSDYEEDFEKDAHAARYRSAALPIPPITDWGPLATGFYAISERVDGEPIDELDESGMRRVLPSLLAALDAMREVDLTPERGFGGWRADGSTTNRSWRETVLGVASGPATRGAPGWRDVLARSPEAVRAFERSFERMRELVPLCPEERHLVHDDLIHFNVLASADRITAILDWGSSIYGDFLYDVAKLVFYRPWYPHWSRIDFAEEVQAHYRAIGLAVSHFSERLLCYALRIGMADMAYSAYRGRWDEVAWKAQRLSELR